MGRTATRFVIRWPTAAVLIVAIVTTALVYALVPASQTGIAVGVAGAWGLVLAFMRRVLGLAPAVALVLAIAVPGMSGCAEARAVLSAAQFAAKFGCEHLCPVVAGTSGSEEP